MWALFLKKSLWILSLSLQKCCVLLRTPASLINECKGKMREGEQKPFSHCAVHIFTGELFRTRGYNVRYHDTWARYPGFQPARVESCKKLVPRWSFLDQYCCREQQAPDGAGPQPGISQCPLPSYKDRKVAPLLLRGKGPPYPRPPRLPLSFRLSLDCAQLCSPRLFPLSHTVTPPVPLSPSFQCHPPSFTQAYSWQGWLPVSLEEAPLLVTSS